MDRAFLRRTYFLYRQERPIKKGADPLVQVSVICGEKLIFQFSKFRNFEKRISRSLEY